MSDIEKLILFKAETSKADLNNNKNFISVLDDNVLSSKAKYTIDSGHMLYITLDVDLLGNLVNNIPEHGVIKTYAQNKNDYWNIVNIDKNLDTVELTCRHWCTETMLSMFIVDSKPRNLSGLAMLDWLKTNSEQYKQGKQFALDLEVGSNLSELKSMNAWHDNFYNIISDLQELYGCEIKKEGFKVELVDYVGSKTPKYKIEYGKNLISNESQEDFNITIGVLAKGYDKLYADNIIYSGKLKDNPNMRGQIVEKEYSIRVREEGKEDEDGYTYFDTEEEAKAELERLAELEFTENHIDEPLITFDTEILELSTVEEHKNDAKVWLSIGDKVATYIPKFNIDIETRIIEMEVDMLTGEITGITLSNNDIKDLKPPTLNSIKQEITKLPSVEDVIITAKNESLNTVMNGFGGYSHYHPNYTAWTDSKDVKQARQGLLANKNGWFFFRNGINIETGEADDVTMIADINGNFSADVINVGTLNADLIKAGILKSVNGESWINMSTGDAQLTGTVITKKGDKYVSINSGGITFQDNHKAEQLLRIASSYLNNRDLNGVIFASAKYADYIRFSNVPIEDLTEGWTSEVDEYRFFDLCANDFIINNYKFYKGMNVKCPMYIRNILNIASNDESATHQIYNNANGLLSLVGDNGTALGYRSGTSNKVRLRVNETADSNGCTINSFGNWNFNNAVLKNCTVSTTLDVQTLSRNTKTEAQAVLSTNRELRVLLEDIQLEHGQATVLNPYPNLPYAISSIVKKGRGDVWIDSEEQESFIIKGENDIKVNIELIIKLEDVGGEVDGSVE